MWRGAEKREAWIIGGEERGREEGMLDGREEEQGGRYGEYETINYRVPPEILEQDLTI